MAASVDSPSPAHLNKDLEDLMASPLPHPLLSSSSLLISPASDKRFWSSLRSRIDTLLENRHQVHNPDLDSSVRKCDRAMRMKEDSLLLLRGFDSISHTLSQLSNNLDNALQGAKRLAEPPTLSEIFQSKINNSEGVQEEDESRDRPEGEEKKGLKRKLNSGDDVGNDSPQETKEVPIHNKKLKKAKNMVISMANKAASLARDLKLLRSDLSFMQERCVLLEEENRRLRDWVSTGIRPEEDDLMRLQMEVLLAEKSRLANENANLVRENQCLHQLVEYHQLTTQDLSASYEQLVHGLHLDYSSPSSPLMEEADYACNNEVDQGTCKTGIARLVASLNDRFDEEQQLRKCVKDN